MLALDDPRWGELRQAYGPADGIPEILRTLERGDSVSGGAEDVWDDIWSSLCHQGTVYTASYAAVPHIVRIGAAVPLADQNKFWAFVGAVAVSTDAAPVPEFLRPAYEEAVQRAELHALDCFRPGIDEESAWWLLIAVAGLRRLTSIEDALQGLLSEEICTSCPRCGIDLYVSTAERPFTVSDDVDGKGRSAPLLDVRDPNDEVRRLAGLATRAGLADLPHQLSTLEHRARCPACEAEFPLVRDRSALAAEDGG